MLSAGKAKQNAVGIKKNGPSWTSGRTVSRKDCPHEMEQVLTKRGKEKDYYGVKGKKIFLLLLL